MVPECPFACEYDTKPLKDGVPELILDSFPESYEPHFLWFRNLVCRNYSGPKTFTPSLGAQENVLFFFCFFRAVLDPKARTSMTRGGSQKNFMQENFRLTFSLSKLAKALAVYRMENPPKSRKIVEKLAKTKEKSSIFCLFLAYVFCAHVSPISGFRGFLFSEAFATLYGRF